MLLATAIWLRAGGHYTLTPKARWISLTSRTGLVECDSWMSVPPFRNLLVMEISALGSSASSLPGTLFLSAPASRPSPPCNSLWRCRNVCRAASNLSSSSAYRSFAGGSSFCAAGGSASIFACTHARAAGSWPYLSWSIRKMPNCARTCGQRSVWGIPVIRDQTLTKDLSGFLSSTVVFSSCVNGVSVAGRSALPFIQ